MATFFSLPHQSSEYSEVFVSSNVSALTNRDNKEENAPQDESRVPGSNSSWAQLDEEATAKSQQRPEPPPQSSKPKLGNVRHLEVNSGTAGGLIIIITITIMTNGSFTYTLRHVHVRKTIIDDQNKNSSQVYNSIRL